MEENRPTPREVLFRERAGLSPALWQSRLNFRFGREKPTVGMAEEDQAHHGQEIFIAREIRICAEGISARPQTCFDFSNVFHLSLPKFQIGVDHQAAAFPLVVMLAIRPGPWQTWSSTPACFCR